MEKYRQAYYYAGDDQKIQVLLEIFSKGGEKRVRELSEVRWTKNKGGDKKIYIYFHKPSDVQGMAMIIWNYPNKADDRWVFVPAIDAVRRIAAMDESEGFVGSDFVYEDGGGRDVDLDVNTLSKEEKLDGHDCYVIESVPKKPGAYSKRVFWIEKDTFLPLQYRYYDIQGKPWKVAKGESVSLIKAGAETFPTLMKMTIKNVQTGGYSVWTVKSATYNQGVDENDFVERHLRNPPSAWVR